MFCLELMSSDTSPELAYWCVRLLDLSDDTYSFGNHSMAIFARRGPRPAAGSHSRAGDTPAAPRVQYATVVSARACSGCKECGGACA
jgi:hypothetical protein